MDNTQLIQFLQQQASLADFRAKSYIEDTHQKKRPQRNIFIRLEKYLTDFLTANKTLRWVTLTGLRGSGKTTLLFQLYSSLQNFDCNRLFLSLDATHGLLGVTLKETLDAYEKLLGTPFEMLEKPLVLFLDEVQYDPTWGITLKNIYDRTNKVFIFSTGSAALMLNTNADIARRTIFEKLHPLSFTEYLKITQSKFETKGLGGNIRDIIFESVDAKDLYEKLSIIQSQVDTYYLGILSTDYQRYLWYGSLPHMLDYENDSLVYEQIQKTLDRIIHSDLPMSNFRPDTVSYIPGILYALADMDSCNVATMEKRFDLSRPKIEDILQALGNAELLRRIYPHGSHINQVATTKPSKYLFTAPAFRAIYFRLTSNIIADDYAKGKITEDLVAMYFYKIFDRLGTGSLTYDSSQGGADFILTLRDKKIVLEIGAGNKGSKGDKQVAHTMSRLGNKASYGIVISEDALGWNEEKNIVHLPLRTFLLM